MGVRAASSHTTKFVGPLVGGAAEVMLFTTGAVVLAADDATVILAWVFNYAGGTTQNNTTFSLRRGNTVTSPLVTLVAWTIPATPALATLANGWYADFPGVAQTAYCLTLHQNAGSGAATFIDGCLMAFVL
jgi:hypothetical protein